MNDATPNGPGPPTQGPPPAPGPRPWLGRWKRWFLGLALAFLAILGAGLFWAWTRPPGPKLVATLRGEAGEYIPRVQFSADGRTLGAEGGAGVILWEVPTWQVRDSVRPPRHELLVSFLLTPDGESLWAPVGGSLRIWDLATGKSKVFQVPTHDTSQMALSPDGKTLAVDVEDSKGTVKLVDTAAGTELATLQGTTFIHSLAFSADGKTLATVDGPGASPSVTVVRLWDLGSRQERKALGPFQRRVIYALAFSPDGQTLAAAGDDDTVQLWNPVTGQPRATWKAGLGLPTCLAFSPDGKVVLAGGGPEPIEGLPPLWPGKVKFWDAASGKELWTLNAHENMVRSMALSPDGKLLAVACEAGKTVKVWDVSALTGKTHDAP